MPGVAVDVLPSHESLRRMMADLHGVEYEAVESLIEAQARTDFAVVMQGDDGGSIYLTCPAAPVEGSSPRASGFTRGSRSRACDRRSRRSSPANETGSTSTAISVQWRDEGP
jgi:hypothetical protein